MKILQNRRSLQMLMLIIIAFLCQSTYTQNYQEWYNNAQQRIDTLRKGDFGVKIIDRNGQPYTGDFSVRMTKHEFPFGIAFDLYEGAVNNGNVYTTTSTVTAATDEEIYQTERWYSFIAYGIPVEKDRNFNITLKFAEIYFDVAGSRIFDVFIEGTKYLSDYDVFAQAGGKNIAVDTTIQITSSDTIINIELISSLDNAAIKGVIIETAEADWITRINCGGGEITTGDGNHYVGDDDYFDVNAPRIPSEEQWMKAAMQKYFNYGVTGNSFKWSGIQPQHTAPDYTAFENAVSWTQSIGWDLRAHTLLWGGADYEDDHAMPRWVKDLPTPQAITDTCKMRVMREVSRYRGIVKEYDVINEPLHSTYTQSVVGDSLNWNCFFWARSVDPDVALFINDYNVEYNWGDAAKYRDLILKIKAEGAPVTGVGLQAHFWQDMRPQLNELMTNINIVAEAGLPMKFTEFDNGNISQEAQAADLAMVTTVAFSHPSFNGIINWALSDRGAWREMSGLFEADHTPKLAADTLYYLTHEKWSTNFDSTANGDTAILFNAYYGKYTIEVNFNDTVKVFTIPCLAANSDSVFVLYEEEAIIKGPVLVTQQLLNDSILQLTFDKKMDNESIRSGDFKFFSENPLRIQKIDIDAVDSTSLIISLERPILPEDYLCVTYFPGTLASVDGSLALAFGPETVVNMTRGLVSAEVTNDGYSVEAKFNSIVRNLDPLTDSFNIWVNNNPVDISEFNLKAGDSSVVVISLSEPVIKNDLALIQYIAGAMYPAEGFDFQSSAKINVNNTWPELKSAAVNGTGTKIDASFGIKLKNVEENLTSFNVVVDGQQAEVSNIVRSGADSSHITINMVNTITRDQVVLLSYTQGTIKGSNGNSLLTFADSVVNNGSTRTALENADQETFNIFPNPAGDFVYFDVKSVPVTILFYNTQGMLVQRITDKSDLFRVDVSDFSRGIYFVEIISNNGNRFSGKLLLE